MEGREGREGQPTSLHLILDPAPEGFGERHLFRPFFRLLQQGFGVRAQIGCSIHDLLCDQFGVDPGYLKTRVTTIFLNGKAIDDPKKSRIGNGATLALSGAMPGLVGATMRAGGYYAAMRGAMTHQESDEGMEAGGGRIKIKLFNLLMAEMGPGFLARGIYLPAGEFAEILEEQASEISRGCRRVLLDGDPLASGLPSAERWEAQGGGEVRLTVTLEE